jgi:hypothetical protein
VIIGIWGEDKSCKSTLALSADRPIVDMEIDVGGFQRACRNLPHLPIKDWVDAGEIVCEQYPLPLQGVKMDNKGNVTFTASKQLVGIKELSYQFLTNYFRHLKDDTTTIMVDTGTLLYNTVICDGYLQELQEKQLSNPNNTLPLRTSLQPLEYREPYDRMRGIVYQAKANRKNLIMTHHASDEYKPMPQKDGGIATQATGNRIYHGWTQLGDSVDIMLHCYIKVEQQESEVNGKKVKRPVRVPYCKVDLASVQELIGTEFREPTLPMIIDTIKMIRGEE